MSVSGGGGRQKGVAVSCFCIAVECGPALHCSLGFVFS